MFLDPHDPTPIYAQLERSIRADIAAGRLRAGDRLPAVRRLAGDLGINPNTVAKVYLALERSGVVTTRRGAGTFVRGATESQPPRHTGREREQFLRQLSDKILAEAHAVGVTIDDVIQHLRTLRPEHG